MSDQRTNDNMGGFDGPERLLTPEQLEYIITEVTKRVQKALLEETDKLEKERELPVEIYEELDKYSSEEFKQYVKKIEQHTRKYKNKEWATPATINPTLNNHLKKVKVDTQQFVDTICLITENTRVQANAATELYECLKHISDRGLEPEDSKLLQACVEKCRRLAVCGFAVAKQQEKEAKEITAKTFKFPQGRSRSEIAPPPRGLLSYNKIFFEHY